MSLFEKLFSSHTGPKPHDELLQKGAVIIDVRGPEEYLAGHLPGSLNIPLFEIEERLDEIKALGRPIVTCCLSGKRSAQATSILKSNGIVCENGGGWKGLK